MKQKIKFFARLSFSLAMVSMPIWSAMIGLLTNDNAWIVPCVLGVILLQLVTVLDQKNSAMLGRWSRPL